MRNPTPAIDRFMPKFRIVDAGYRTPCWLWTACTAQGYGRFGRGLAHRWAYEWFVGPIPTGLDIDHLCRNRACVNPEHLEPVTRRVNLLRGETLPAAYMARTHCAQGHALAGDNLYISPDGSRRCRACIRAYQQTPERKAYFRRWEQTKRKPRRKAA